MPYYLSEAFLNGQIYEIEEGLYLKLKRSLTSVVSAMEIEESFHVFAHSFLSFERDMLNFPMEYAYPKFRWGGDEEFLSYVRQRFNVNIITILTSFQSYDDHCNRILESNSFLEEARNFNLQARSNTFNKHLSYRICANLRNYAQHRALPLGGFSIGGKANFDHDNDGRTRKIDTGFYVAPWLNVTKFKSSSQCKAQVRADLDSLGYEKIDLKWLMRKFAEAVYERHSLLREFMKPMITAADKEISAAYDFAGKIKSNEAKFLELHGPDYQQSLRSDLPSKVMRNFEAYTFLKNLGNSYITSRIVPDATIYSGKISICLGKIF